MLDIVREIQQHQQDRQFTYNVTMRLIGTTIVAVRNNILDCVWNVFPHAQKPDFVFRRNGRVHLSRGGGQFSRLLAVEVCASAVVMLDTPCSEIVWRVLATHCIRQFPLHFFYLASPCAITFQLDCTAVVMLDTPCSELVWRVLATHSIHQCPLHFPSLRHRVPSHFKWTLQR